MPDVPLRAVLVAAAALALIAGPGASSGFARAEEVADRTEPAERTKGRLRLNLGSSPVSRAASHATRPPAPDELKAFTHGRLLPRVSSSLRSVSVLHDAGSVGMGLHEHAMLDRMTRSAKRGFTRATKRSVRDFLLETTDLDRRVDRQVDIIEGSIKRALRRRRVTAGPEAGSAEASSWTHAAAPGSTLTPEELSRLPRSKRRSPVDFDLGISSFRPRLDVEYRLTGGAMNLSLGSGGSVNLEGSVNRWPGTRFRAGIDREDRLSMSCRIAF